MIRKILILSVALYMCLLTMASTVLQNNNIDTPINKSYVPGDIECSADVNNLGDLTLNIPIKTPSAPIGISPSLNLVYNSNGGEGFLGRGWSLSGISLISRTNKILHYDGKTEGIKNNNDDAFTLDGKRLVRISSLGSDIIFKTDNDYTKVIGHLSGSTFSGFTVYYPNGNKAEYSCSDSINYYISQCIDRIGNKIVYSYIDNNCSLINKISYGKNLQNSIEFSYVNNQACAYVRFVAGKIFQHDKLLSEIRINTGNHNIREYKINYTEKYKNVLVDNIKCTVDGNELNPLIFNYGDSEKNKNFSQSGERHFKTGINNPGENIYITATLNNQENSSLLYYKAKSPYCLTFNNKHVINEFSENDSIYLYESMKTEFVPSTYPPTTLPNWDDNFNWQNTTPQIPTPSRTITGKGFIGLLSINTNYNRAENVIKINNYVENGKDRLTFTVLNSNLSKKDECTFDLNVLLSDGNIVPKKYIAGDYDGDGQQEILVMTELHSSLLRRNKYTTEYFIIDIPQKKIINNLNNNKNILFYSESKIHGNSISKNLDIDKNSDKLIATDYDGDGKTDLVLINKDGLEVYSYNVRTNEFELIKVNSNLKLKHVAGQVFLTGDFNHDGKHDFLLSINNTKYWYFIFSKGDGTYEKCAIKLCDRETDASYYVDDINGDGISDIIAGKEKSMTAYLIHIKRKKPAGTFGGSFTGSRNGEQPSYSSTREHGDPNAPHDQAINIEADTILSNMSAATVLLPYKENKTSYIRIFNNAVRMIGFTQDTGNDIQLKNVIKSNGEIFDFKYKKTDLGISNLSYPLINNNVTRLVCSEINSYYINDKTNSLQCKKYEYGVPYVNLEGLGFMGYETISKENIFKTNIADSTGVAVKSMISKYDPYKLMSLKSVQSSDMKSVEYDYILSTDENKWSRLCLENIVEKNEANGTAHTTKFDYDNYGNIVRQYDDFGDGIIKNTSTVYENTDLNNRYILGAPLIIKEEHERNGDNSSSEILYSYNELYQPTKKIVKKNDKIAQTEYYSYNEDNIRSAVTVNLYESLNGTTESYTYDDNGFVKTLTDRNGHTTEFKYDDRNLLISQTDYKRNTTNFSHDALGRLKKITMPTGCIKTSSIEWSDYDGAVYKIISNETGKPEKIEYYNIYGECVRTKAADFDGTYICIDRKYDRSGRLTDESYPYKTNAGNWKKYVYDNADRVISITSTTGLSTTYSYNGLTTTVCSNGKEERKTYDVAGNIIEVIDANGGKTKYEYNADGLLTRVKAPGAESENVTTNITYDEFGRKKTVENASHGTFDYTYDENGFLSSMTDGKGNTTSYQNNIYGLPQVVKNDYQTTKYTYNDDNQISKITCSNGYTRTYNYDGFSRIANVKNDNLDGKSFSTELYYRDGNISYILYSTPTNRHLENYVYKNGHIVGVNVKSGNIFNVGEDKNLNDKSAYRLTATNMYGLPTLYYTGKIKHSKSYNPDGNLTSMKSELGNNILLDIDYEYDTRGNIISCSDNIHNKTEKFSYDSIDRLTEYGKKSVEYDVKGNITKSDAGSYSYSSANPYAVESIKTMKNRFNDMFSIDYNALNRPSVISNLTEKYKFDYDEKGDRIKMTTLSENDITKEEKYYFGDKYELLHNINSEKGVFYVGGDAYSAGMAVVDEDGEASDYYILRDRLGSIMKIVDEEGNVKQDVDYDAWGNIRNPETEEEFYQQPDLFLGRGYTGHEHIAKLNIINMNARIYDPVLGRFISPDPMLNFGNGQAMNLYSYANNNPMLYVDRDGKVSGLLIGAAVLVGAWIGGSAANHSLNPAKWSWSSPETYCGMLLGGVTGLAGSEVVVSGSLGYSFAVATPYFTLGSEFYRNNNNGWSNIPVYKTAGGFDINNSFADNSVGKSLDKLGDDVIKMCESYHYMRNNLENEISYKMSSCIIDGVEYAVGSLSTSDYKYIINTSNLFLKSLGKGFSYLFVVDKIIDAIGRDEEFGYYTGKAIVDSTSSIIGGKLGIMIGATSGTFVFPGIGTLAGGIVGGFLFSNTFSYISCNFYDAIWMNYNGLNNNYILPSFYLNDFNNNYINFLNGGY